jgi:GNAT superfamily N-acetyltransferase
MTIRKAHSTDMHAISMLANEIWWTAYTGILSDEQIGFMLKDIYYVEALKKQLHEGVRFLIIENDNLPVGFAGYSILKDRIRIHKLYILPAEQGKGAGKKLLEHITNEARAKGIKILELNVNRANPAVNFYKNSGFEIEETVDIPYYGFVLNDYVMRKNI